ncbi:MAG: AEC family transporter [Bifidobacteriaceae bacterium]|jgi:predicted permease|nr:AEC family transporter [Bifidobacteriaceae bacterium]
MPVTAAGAALSSVAPILFVLALGFGAGRAKAFDAGAISALNTFVLTFALPCSLFVGTVKVKRAVVMGEMVLFGTLAVVMLGMFAAVYLVARHLAHRPGPDAAIQAIAVGFAAGPFYGPALLGELYGTSSEVAVSLVTVVLNVTMVPITTILIKVGLAHESGQAKGLAATVRHVLVKAVFGTPFVWAPLLAFALVLVGVSLPKVVLECLSLIGVATSGAAVFVAGLTVAAQPFRLSWEVGLNVTLKNLVMPALFAAVALAFGLRGGTLFGEGFLLSSLPTGPMAVLLATRYGRYRAQASSTLAVSTVAMAVTVTLAVGIVHP